jgi:hypothetical protein
VGVDLLRGRECPRGRGWPERREGDLQSFEQRCDHVADLVHRDQPDAMLLAEPGEGSHQIAWLDRPAGAGREDETVSAHAEPSLRRQLS